MKLYIDRYDETTSRLDGKTLFCNRLGTSLKEGGLFVTGDPNEQVDISLNVVCVKHQKSDTRILRLNGVCFDLDRNYKAKNGKLIAALRKADGVVYQSQFSRQMCDRFLGTFDGPSRVILNGTRCSSERCQAPNKYSFLTFARWRVFKRLHDTIESFLLSDIDDSKLYVVGDVSESGVDLQQYKTNPKVEFLGQVGQGTLSHILSFVVGSIHLSWFDSCPNSVVEAVAAGVPVVCGNVGGTKEIVGPSGGFVCEIDDVYDFEPVRVYDPPPIDRRVVADAIRKCAMGCLVTNDHVSIDNVASQYREFMLEVWK